MTSSSTRVLRILHRKLPSKPKIADIMNEFGGLQFPYLMKSDYDNRLSKRNLNLFAGPERFIGESESNLWFASMVMKTKVSRDDVIRTDHVTGKVKSSWLTSLENNIVFFQYNQRKFQNFGN